MEKSEEAHVHIESIRRERFYIGREEKNPLAQIVHRTVNYLSEELYSKDVHFLMELIQNAEDNQYPEGVAPSLEFIITSKDLTESGAASTLMVCNNERGFSSDNIDSICGAGISTKKGNRHCGYIGEKGNGILLCNKHDVFIPDDLLLKDLFDNSQESIFVWYPSPSLAATSRAKMNAIYTSLGARKISEAVKMDQSSISELKEINSKESIIKPGLIKLVLGFLSDPVLDISVKNKHHILKYLIDTIVFETEEPIAVSYSLSLSSGKKISVKTSRILRWERESSKLFIQKTDRLLGKKTQIEYATYFAEVISEGLLFERADKIGELDKLLKLGCLLDFDDAAVDFLMKSKNLEVFAEDEEFLSSEFSSLKIS